MKPKTGLIVDLFYRGGLPSKQEKELGEWAERRGLFLVLSSYQDDNGVQHDTCDLGIEEYDEGTIYCYMLAMPTIRSIWPEALDHYEKLLHAGIEREKEERARFKWWEHVS